MTMNTRVALLLIALIMICGGMLRLFGLSSNPPGFFADEAIIGLDAYSLIRFGVDHSSNPPGFLFPGLGFTLGFIPIISAIPSIYLLGLTEQAVRLPQAIYGTLSIFLIYAIAKFWFGNKVGLVAAFFLAFSPWHVHISRIGMEIMSYYFWFTLSVWLFLLALRKPYLLFVAFISFGISLYTYNPARLMVPITLLALFTIYHKTFLQPQKKCSLP